MADRIHAFVDSSGGVHKTAEAAVLADLTASIGSSREGPNIARMVFEHRAAIEKAFADFDQLTGKDAA